MGSASGSDDFVNCYVQDKVSTSVAEIDKLSEIAITQPKAAYAVFMHVFLHHWSFVPRTVPWSPNLFHPLDDVMNLCILPVLTQISPPLGYEAITTFVANSL